MEWWKVKKKDDQIEHLQALVKDEHAMIEELKALFAKRDAKLITEESRTKPESNDLHFTYEEIKLETEKQCRQFEMHRT